MVKFSKTQRINRLYHQYGTLRQRGLLSFAIATPLGCPAMTAIARERTRPEPAPQLDWQQVDHTVLVSRALDELEEPRLLPERKVLYQFTARGHDVTQALLGQMLTGTRDGGGVYYRSRPLMLALGLTIEDALASTMMRSGSVSEGRDIGVVFNLPRH